MLNETVMLRFPVGGVNGISKRPTRTEMGAESVILVMSDSEKIHFISSLTLSLLQSIHNNVRKISACVGQWHPYTPDSKN